MSNKRIQVSDNGGTTYYSLPGNQGEFREELNMVNDTIFGQNFESMSPGLGQWNITANGIFKGVAGYNAILKKGGTPTSMSAEACSLVSGKTYQITAATKRVISFEYALTILDNGVDHTADVETIDYLTGKVTFASTYTVTGPVTVTGRYIPLTTIAKAKSFTLTQTSAPVDESSYDTAQSTGGLRTFSGGLKTVGLQLGGIMYATNAWRTTLEARSIFYLEVDLDAANAGTSIFRGVFKLANRVETGNQGALEEENLQFNLYVPDGDVVLQPFGWYFSSSTLNTAIQKTITAWAAQTSIKVRYLPTGATGASPLDGVYGDAIPVECSLANTVEGLNTFSFNYRGTGAPTAV